MRVIFGCPIANRAWAVAGWAEGIRAAADTAGVLPEMVCVHTPSDDDTLDALHQEKITVLAGPATTRRQDHIDGHIWDGGAYSYMALLRNQLLKFVQRQDPDWFFSLDSDILLEAGDLWGIGTSMPADADAVAPLVDLSSWHGFHYNFMYKTDDPNSFERRELGVSSTANDYIKVDAIMAAMLIKRSAFTVQWQYHPLGEDLGWSLNAGGKNLYVDTRTELTHRWHP